MSGPGAMLAVLLAAGAIAPQQPAFCGGLDRAAAASQPVALAAAPRPPISKRLIPYGAKRKRDMAGSSKRHYGQNTFRLTDPKLIVIHFAVAGSVDAIYNTFAPNRPDVEYGELPGVCSQYAVSAKGNAVRFVPDPIRCRHVVGLNHVSIGIEHVGFSDGDVLNNKREFRGSLRLTRWLRCRYGIPIKGVIGHNESLSSPFYVELDPDFRGRTHGDFKRASMRIYRRELRELGSC